MITLDDARCDVNEFAMHTRVGREAFLGALLQFTMNLLTVQLWLFGLLLFILLELLLLIILYTDLKLTSRL